MANKGGGRRRTLKNGLTPKENAFKNKLLEQIATTGEINGTQAALSVYDTTDPNTANQIAIDKLQKPTIREQVEQALEGQGLTPGVIMGNFKKIASSEPQKWTDATLLKANIELAKLWGMYPDKKSAHLRINMKGKVSDLSYSEARERLSRLQGKLSTFMEETE